jgi:hypothetical protein
VEPIAPPPDPDALAAAQSDSLDLFLTNYEAVVLALEAMPEGSLDPFVRNYQKAARQLEAAGVLHLFARNFQAVVLALPSAPTGVVDLFLSDYCAAVHALTAIPYIRAGLLTNTYFSQVSEALHIIENSSVEVKSQQKISKRESAAWLTVIAFLVIYIWYAAAIKNNIYVAQIAAEYGPTPFDAAMAVGALVFWASMNHSGGSSDK